MNKDELVSNYVHDFFKKYGHDINDRLPHHNEQVYACVKIDGFYKAERAIYMSKGWWYLGGSLVSDVTHWSYD